MISLPVGKEKTTVTFPPMATSSSLNASVGNGEISMSEVLDMPPKLIAKGEACPSGEEKPPSSPESRSSL